MVITETTRQRKPYAVRNFLPRQLGIFFETVPKYLVYYMINFDEYIALISYLALRSSSCSWKNWRVTFFDQIKVVSVLKVGKRFQPRHFSHVNAPLKCLALDWYFKYFFTNQRNSCRLKLTHFFDELRIWNKNIFCR